MVVAVLRFICRKKSTMVKILNVAEKNDASKSLSEIMARGRYRRREGFSQYNKIYEFEYNILGMANCTMTFTSVSGHLLGLEFVGSYRGWRSCNPVSLFDAPVEKQCSEDMLNIKRTLEREARACQHLVIWTDCDREGENIGYEVIDVCTAVNRNLRVHRARFSEITPGAVARAVSNLVPPDKNTSDAVDVRQELDLRIGAAFTRFQTLRLQKVFPAVLADQLISYGSCQFPTLGFVVERYKQVQAFIPEPFWKIRVLHETDEEEKVEFSWKRNRLFDHLACLVLYQHVLEDPVAEVIDVRSKPKSKWRPAALDTVEMEKIVSRKLRIGAKETMKIAEKLYTQGFISYPRTETNIFPKDLDLHTLVQNQTQDPNWGGFAANLLQGNGPTPRNGTKSDQAHPPIHPTKYTHSLQGNEARVYEFIVRHFLACCSADAQGQETSVDIVINAEHFSASGLMIIARNYLDVYPYDKWNSKVIPVFYKGDRFRPKSIELTQGATTPPALLTEADLIALMEKHGIGTDATHAEHIETIKARLYVGVRDDGRFIPGELGMGLVEGYDAMGYEMSKPHLRSELEADLKRICEGQKNKDVVLRSQVQKYKEVFLQAAAQAAKIDEALSQYFGNAASVSERDITPNVSPPVRLCARCETAQMVIKTKKDSTGLYLSCMGYPSCKNAVWFPDSVLEAEATEEICSQCKPAPVKKVRLKFKKGSVPPYIPNQYTTCLSCDREIQEVLDLDVRSFTKNTANSAADRSTSSTSGGGRTTPQSSQRNHQRQNSQPRDSGYGSRSSGGTNSLSSRTPLAPMNSLQSGRGGRGGGNHGNSALPPGLLPSRGRQPPGGNNRGGKHAVTPPPGPGGGGAGFGGRRGFPDSGGLRDVTGAGAETVVCGCGEDARLLTVRKDGPNQGRQFYSCPKPQDDAGRCGFFLWADQRDTSGGSTFGAAAPDRGYSNPPAPAARQQNYGADGGSDVSCNCGIPGKLLTVRKDGPNQGRQFYACSKPQQEGCGFFQWADEQAATPGGSGGKRANSGSTDPAKKRRKCGLCGEEGHNRKNCPHK